MSQEGEAAPAVLVTREAGVTLVQLNRPASRNAMTTEIKAILSPALLAFFEDPEQRCLVVTGVDEAFCAGGDLKAFARRQTFQEAYDRMAGSHPWIEQMLTGPKPVLAAVNGPAVGAGFGLALLADLVFVADDAFMQPGFSAVGLVPDFGIGLTLPRLTGAMRARRILFDNLKISAKEAVDWGLAVSAHPRADLLSHVMTQARRLAEGPTRALGGAKRLIDEGYRQPVAAYLRLEASEQAQAFSSDDHAEGLKAFGERRRAVFTGR